MSIPGSVYGGDMYDFWRVHCLSGSGLRGGARMREQSTAVKIGNLGLIV
jgi:hypothetical protein